jgi:hypothetical protein
MTGLEGYLLSLSITCPKCRGPMPVNGFAEALACPGCGADRALPVDWWVSLFDRDTLHSVRGLAVGEGQKWTSMGSVNGEGMLGRRLPRCGGCEQDASVDRLAELAAEGGYDCSCGRRIAVREAGGVARAVIPGARWVVGEQLRSGDDGTDGAASPVLFSCMGCGGSLTVDGTERSVACSYCGASSFLPDALWHRLHPRPTVEPFFVVADPDRRGAPLDPRVQLDLADSDRSDARTVVAANPAASAELLARLASDPDWHVRAAVGANPGADEATLRLLLTDDDDDVRQAVACRPALPAPILATLIDDEDYSVRKQAAQHPDLAPEALVRLAGKERDSDVLGVLSRRRHLDGPVFAALCSNPDADARQVAARHPDLPAELLLQLSRDSSYRVRQVVASRPDLPDEVLLRLGRDGDSDVYRAAREHPRFDGLNAADNLRRLKLGLALLAIVLLTIAVFFATR